jgi:hypothetical protein
MLKALATLSAAVLLAAAQPAWAQPCPGCGRTGPHSMHPRGHVFHGGELTPLPPVARQEKEETQPTQPGAPAMGARGAKPASEGPELTARRVSRSTAAEPVEEGEKPEAASKTPARSSARRQAPQDIPRDSIADPFSLVPPLKPRPQVEPQQNPAPPPAEATADRDERDDADLHHDRPRFYYSGSQFPYYYGRSFVSYPHYNGWHETTTNMHKTARKDRKHSWWTMPVGPSEEWVQTQHGLEPEQGPELAAPRPGAAARRVLSGLWQR